MEPMRANRERCRRPVDAEFSIDEFPGRCERSMAGEPVKLHMVC
ncbi:MAG: hypothetical protein ABI831_20450 [Betaproteobacteria bacterium]